MIGYNISNLIFRTSFSRKGFDLVLVILETGLQENVAKEVGVQAREVSAGKQAHVRGDCT